MVFALLLARSFGGLFYRGYVVVEHSTNTFS
jgi:hypothetical protein